MARRKIKLAKGIKLDGGVCVYMGVCDISTETRMKSGRKA